MSPWVYTAWVNNNRPVRSDRAERAFQQSSRVQSDMRKHSDDDPKPKLEDKTCEFCSSGLQLCLLTLDAFLTIANPFRLLALKTIFIILDNLTMIDIATLHIVSRLLQLTTQRYLDGEFNILLARYGLPAEAFRAIMANDGAVIGGQAALNYLCHINSPHHTLSIFIPKAYAENLLHLLGSLEFIAQPKVYCTHFGPSGIYHTITFAPPRTSNSSLIIKIVFTGRLALHPFTRGWTTAHMSFITADTIHTSFPVLTFANRAIVPRRQFRPAPYTSRLAPLEVLPVAAKPYVDRLRKNHGFNIQRAFCWGKRACGSACGVNQLSIFGGFNLKMSEIFPQAHSALGPDIRFTLSDECRNPHCPNFCVRL